ncbi:MAG TPA: TonB-dependent receptor [Reyranella sp.]|nr:TonB-dependent receptor [Reyranella sp.]
MPEIVVTATGRPEPVTQFAGTVQLIDQQKIEKSSARSITDILAENAVGFLSEWTAGQTSLNIRGGATEGQGRDYKSQVLVLINGHRAGTANISKLSLADVERIEIVRGPSSVVYGSQNMGGVVNIIMKTGRTAPGTMLEATTGSWGLAAGKAQSGGRAQGFDWYVGLAGGTRGNYQVGGGRSEENTAWNREGGTVSLGWQINDRHRIDITARTDGVYNTGFRGSSANIFAFDTRYNQSLDATYNGEFGDGWGGLMFQGYSVHDVDDLNNPAVVSGIALDHNHREIDIIGTRFQPRLRMVTGNELLLGIDWERSWITSWRARAGLSTVVAQVSPQDNNETDNVWAFYAEDSQKFFDDKVVVRGGVRSTSGTTTTLVTPFTTLVPNSVVYQALTYSAGATYKATDWLNTRIGISSGFRAPTATELGSNFTTTPAGNTIFGNPGLVPETSRQIEVGATLTDRNAHLDVALFQNMISNRIRSVVTSVAGAVTISQFQNNPGDLVMQGIELEGEVDAGRTLGFDLRAGDQWSLFGSGYYNFTMTDYGAYGTQAKSLQATRVYEYEASLGTRYARIDGEMPWNTQLIALLRGPMYYNTEETLNPLYFPGQIVSTTVYRKDPFWVLNWRGEIDVRKGITAFGGINNITDENQSPIFIVTDSVPCLAKFSVQNGSCGNSMPGREFFVGGRVRF